MSNKQSSQPRPWYCNDRLVDDYKTIHRTGGDLKMLKGLKILRSIIVNVGIIAISVITLLEGGDPTVSGPLSLVILAAYNGIEIADYQALARAILELSQEQQDSADNPSDNDDS